MSKNWSTALKAHLAQPTQTIAKCVLVTLANGTKYGFTDHDQDISASALGDTLANGNYQAYQGFTSKAVQTTMGMSVDTTETTQGQIAPAMTQHDVVGGTWDYSQWQLFIVNYKDLTMGKGILRTGRLGEANLGLYDAVAEIRGLLQAYTKTLCELTSPGCRANFGDNRCNANLVPFTVTGTLTGVNPDNQTLYDSGRTESGPTGGVSITGITNANPGVVTLASGALNLVNGQTITIAGVLGMTQVNVVTVALNPTLASPFTFQLSVDTTSFPAYISGGTVTPYSGTGGTTGYFDQGKITFTSGNNNGLSQEVTSYVPGQIYLFLPMPFQCAIGDTYTMIVGCDKSVQMCRDRFSNLVNFRGEPYLRGLDQLLQVGRGTSPAA